MAKSIYVRVSVCVCHNYNSAGVFAWEFTPKKIEFLFIFHLDFFLCTFTMCKESILVPLSVYQSVYLNMLRA